MKMSKLSAAMVAVLCCSGLFLNSCMYEVPVYGGVSYNNGYSYANTWEASSYDANGFPIFGYYRGRPVYGYTPEGVAIFTFAALTAACLVPLWAPAPWYHGHWHYPHHIHRVSVPPHCPHDHHPSMHPHGGLNAPIHKEPHRVLQGNRAPQPQRHGNDVRPHQGFNASQQPDRRHEQPNKGRIENKHGHNQPGISRFENKRGQQNNVPVFNPQQHRGQQHNAPQQRHEARPNQSHEMQLNQRPQINAPQQHNRPQMNAPHINGPQNRPDFSANAHHGSLRNAASSHGAGHHGGRRH